MNNPAKPEIDHRTLKLLVGVIALSLGSVTSFLSGSTIDSISAAYWAGGWSQSIFIGFLFAIATFLVAYNGEWWQEMVFSRVASAGALGVALFPCGCGGNPEIIPYVHYVSAAIMFLVLAYFCYVFYRRARMKGHAEANRRAIVYVVCGVVIVASILILVVNTLTGGALVARVDRLVFYCESAALVAFGLSWLTASRILPLLTSRSERFSPLA